jgi:hypothetical protein
VRFAIKTRPEHTTWAQIRDVDPGDGAGPAAEAAAAYRDAGADLAIMNLQHGAEPAILAPLADALSPLR